MDDDVTGSYNKFIEQTFHPLEGDPLANFDHHDPTCLNIDGIGLNSRGHSDGIRDR